MKILITGGHLTPALSVIEKLDKKDKVFYIGRKHVFEGDSAISFEYQKITSMGIPFYEIKTGRLQRKVTRFTLISLLKIPGGFYKAYKLLNEIKPDVVLGFGSYISVPVGLAAKVLKIPLIIHEQALEPGYANRILGRFADKICISWETSKKFFPQDKTTLTGNPVRKEIKELTNIQENSNLIYISGGSSGSHAINVLVGETIERLLKDFIIIHQTGDSQKYKDFDKLINIKNNLPKTIKHKYDVRKFLDTNQVGEAMAKASLFVGRAGINTITELIVLGKPSFLIPLAFSNNSEQVKNAKFIKKLGLSDYAMQDEITQAVFYDKLNVMHKNRNNYRLINKINIGDAAQEIIKIISDVFKKKKIQ